MIAYILSVSNFIYIFGVNDHSYYYTTIIVHQLFNLTIVSDFFFLEFMLSKGEG